MRKGRKGNRILNKDKIFAHNYAVFLSLPHYYIAYRLFSLKNLCCLHHLEVQPFIVQSNIQRFQHLFVVGLNNSLVAGLNNSFVA